MHKLARSVLLMHVQLQHTYMHMTLIYINHLNDAMMACCLPVFKHVQVTSVQTCTSYQCSNMYKLPVFKNVQVTSVQTYTSR